MRRRAGLAAAWVAAAAVAAAAAPAAALAQDAPLCDDLPSLPPDADRCAFVRAHCDPEGVLPLLPLYFCYVRPLGTAPAALAVAACAALLVLLFKVMGHAADEYFSSILAQISQDCGLPPRLGGVTLLALGNGAPDLSSSIAAVRSGNYPLALGALTGGAMFVGCVVAGRIVAAAGGVRARAAQIRDVLTQFVAVATVTTIIATGRMTYGAVAALLSLYVAYVVVVAVADFSKRAGVEWGDVGRDLGRTLRARSAGLLAPLLQRGGDLGNGGGASAATAAAQAPWRQRQQAATSGSSGRGSGTENGGLVLVEEEVLDAAAAESVAAAAAAVFGSSPGPTVTEVPSPSQALERASSGPDSEVELTATTPPASLPRTPRGLSSPAPGADRGFPHPPVRATMSAPAAASLHPSGSGGSSGSGGGGARRAHATHQPRLGYDELLHMPAQEYRLRALADMAAAGSFFKRPQPGGAGEAPSTALDRLSESEEEEEELLAGVDEERGEYTPPQVAPLAPSGPAPGGPPAAAAPKPEEPRGPVGEVLAAANARLDAIVRPAILTLRATVPIVEAASYDRPWFLAAMHLSPLFICFYVGALGPGALAAAGAAGAAAGLACRAATARLGAAPPTWDLGTGYPLGAGLIAVYGFGVAAMWIDVFASEIVGIIHFFGLLAGADPAVLGVTVLAWGNSLTDLVANSAMALRSQAGTSMAMTACFAGPLFNLLVGLGVGFWAYLADAGVASTPVVFDPVVAVGCAFTMAACVGVTAAAAANGRRLPGRFGWVMVGWYGVYMAVILIIVLR